LAYLTPLGGLGNVKRSSWDNRPPVAIRASGDLSR